jgi:hypothetical protein
VVNDGVVDVAVVAAILLLGSVETPPIVFMPSKPIIEKTPIIKFLAVEVFFRLCCSSIIILLDD